MNMHVSSQTHQRRESQVQTKLGLDSVEYKNSFVPWFQVFMWLEFSSWHESCPSGKASEIGTTKSTESDL